MPRKFQGFGEGGALGSQLVLFKSNLLRTLGAQAKKHVFTDFMLASKTLAGALTWEIQKVGPRIQRVLVGVPHYWAIWYHEGHQAYNMPTRNSTKKLLVFYLDPDDDPRLAGFRPGYPTGRHEAPTLDQVITKEDLRADLSSGRAMMVSGIGGTNHNRFLSEPMKTFDPSRAVRDALTKFIRKNVVVRDRRKLTIDLDVAFR